LLTRPRRQVRPSDVTTVTVVTSEVEWDILRNKLDQRVREMLAKGFHVEID
jgi:hypothetical protein